jgi:N-acylglucosamine 2-epimerase
MSLMDYAQRYRTNLLECVIPFWAKHSIDREYGGYFTCLDRDGSVYDTRKYVWLQGRQIWMFSRLYNEVERRQEWLDIATIGMEFLLRHGTDGAGRYFFRLARDGRPSFFQRKPYAAVFAMLAMLEYSKTGAGDCHRKEAIRLFWRIRDWIREPALLDRPPLAGQSPVRQLADSMVIASLALELSSVDDDPRYRQIMTECVEEALLHYDAQRSILIETVTEHGARIDLPEGRLFNPGHSIETAWFLWHVLERLGPEFLQPRQKTILSIMEGSLALGWDQEYGGLYYFMDIEGKPTLQLESTMKLWWPHTEALYAVILAYTRTGESRWLNWLERLDDYTFRRFADQEAGGEWFGYCDRQGNLTTTLKGNHYKGCFHVPRFLLYSAQQIESVERKPA